MKRRVASGARGIRGVEDTVVGAGASVTGDIVAAGPVRIEGSFSGSVRTEGHFVLAAGGFATADIDAGSAAIAGTLVGNVNVRGALRVLASAVLRGDLRAADIDMEEGAALAGALFIGAPEGAAPDFSSRSQR